VLSNISRANARLMATRLVSDSALIAEAVRRGEVKIVAAFYNLATGLVEWL
jgi:hypothetical protein